MSDSPSPKRPPRRRHPAAVRLAIRQDYLAGLGTVAELAARHGLPLPTVEDWAKYGEWGKARRRALANREANMEGSPPPPPPAPVTIATSPASHAQSSVLALESHITALDERLREARTADDWHKLTTARQRLHDQWCRLVGLPREGARRPARDKRAVAVTVEPLAG